MGGGVRLDLKLGSEGLIIGIGDIGAFVFSICVGGGDGRKSWSLFMWDS